MKNEIPAIVDEDGQLQCPLCDSETFNLHQGKVTSYHRGEDAKETMIVEADMDIVTTRMVKTSPGDGNPSTRRHGLRIEFYCEHCNQDLFSNNFPNLLIYQHKGTTYVAWEKKQ